MQCHSSYANTVTDSTSVPSSKPSHVIPFESQELVDDSLDNSDDNAINKIFNNMLFMHHENVIVKDGKGITREVSYLGPQYSDEILQHKVRNVNGHKFLVDGTLLSSINAPDIGTIPVSVEQYANELPKLTREQLRQVSHPQILDDDQREFMGLNYKMNHLPLPAMITLAEKGKLNRKFAELKHRLPVCMSCMFGTAHRKPWRSKGEKDSIRKPTDNAPGKCVSIDQMISAQPGLIPQMPRSAALQIRDERSSSRIKLPRPSKIQLRLREGISSAGWLASGIRIRIPKRRIAPPPPQKPSALESNEEDAYPRITMANQAHHRRGQSSRPHRGTQIRKSQGSHNQTGITPEISVG
jgi:hypothetical protein